MFKRISKENYPIIKKFVNKYKYSVEVNSILDGKTTGFVFADDKKNPRIAIILDKRWHASNLFGEIKNLDKFNQQFLELIHKIVKLEEEKIENNKALLISFFPEDHWLPNISKIVEEKYLDRMGEWSGTFSKESYLKFKNEFKKSIPENLKLIRISSELLDLEVNDALRTEILIDWNTLSDFFAQGFGFCVVKDQRIITSAFSRCIADERYYEISIKTFDENERRKGLATHCSLAYIDYCMEKAHTPFWVTDYDNFASQKLATKLGFIKPEEHNRFLFLFDRSTNYVYRAYCHFNLFFTKEVDMEFINFCIKKSFEDKNSKPNPGWVYGLANRMASKQIKESVVYLLDEFLKLYPEGIHKVKENNTFEILHNDEEWGNLISKHSLE